MISLRHHMLTIVAVFLALAAGIVLGGGPLSDVGPGVAAAGGSSDEPTTTESTAGEDYTDAVLTALGPAVVSGRLAERSVALVTVPGADERLVSALSGAIAEAGGAVTSRYALRDDLVDPGQKSLVDTLGSQLLTQQGDDVIAADASTYDRFGQLIGLAVASTDPAGQDVSGKSRAVLDAITGAGLMDEPEATERRAPLVLLVLGTDAADDGSDAVLAGIAAGLAGQATGVVVVGTLADGGSGQLGRLRADPAAAVVASVDGIDTIAGRVATIFALQRSLETDGGSFGASGADGVLPLG